MYGAFYVVEDIATYLADPPAYLATTPCRFSTICSKTIARAGWGFDVASSVERAW